MNLFRSRGWIFVCGTSLLAVLGIALARAQSTPQKAASESGSATTPKLAEEEYKNIQALKGIPAEQLIPSMQFIAASLGVVPVTVIPGILLLAGFGAYTAWAALR